MRGTLTLSLVATNDFFRFTVAREATKEDQPKSPKKRMAQDSVDVFPPPKRDRKSDLVQSLINPRPKQKRSGVKGGRPLISSETVQVNTSSNFDFDMIPKPEQEATHTRARAMKRKDGKQVADVRPVVEKNGKPKLFSRTALAIPVAMDLDGNDEIDHDKTLVEHVEVSYDCVEQVDTFISYNLNPLMDDQDKAGRRLTRHPTSYISPELKSVTEQKDKDRPKKSSRAPWERGSFLKIKEETLEDMSILLNSVDNLIPQANYSTSNRLPSTESDNTSQFNEESFQDKYVDFEVPLKVM